YCNQDDLCFQNLAISQRDLGAVGILLDLFVENTGVELDAPLLESTLQGLDDGWIFVWNQRRQALNDGDVDADGLPYGSEFDTNQAAAKNDSALRQVFHVQCFGAGQYAAADFQTHGLGSGAGSQDDVLALVDGAIDIDGVLGNQSAVTGDNVDPLHLQQALQALVLSSSNAFLVLTNASQVDRLQRGVDAVLGTLASVLGQLCC